MKPGRWGHSWCLARLPSCPARTHEGGAVTLLSRRPAALDGLAGALAGQPDESDPADDVVAVHQEIAAESPALLAKHRESMANLEALLDHQATILRSQPGLLSADRTIADDDRQPGGVRP